jgi:hypothetical protein
MSTTMTMTRETYAPVVCASWCTYRDGHPGCRHSEDRVCFGEDHRVVLTREPLLEGDRPDNLCLYLGRGYQELPHVFLGRVEDSGAEMTLDEARELRDVLSALLARAVES